MSQCMSVKHPPNHLDKPPRVTMLLGMTIMGPPQWEVPKNRRLNHKFPYETWAYWMMLGPPFLGKSPCWFLRYMFSLNESPRFIIFSWTQHEKNRVQSRWMLPPPPCPRKSSQSWHPKLSRSGDAWGFHGQFSFSWNLPEMSVFSLGISWTCYFHWDIPVFWEIPRILCLFMDFSARIICWFSSHGWFRFQILYICS